MSLHKKRRQRMAKITQERDNPVEIITMTDGGRTRTVKTIDIYGQKFPMPDKVYVLAPGPNGIKAYKKIPPSSYVIAVNSAVMIPASHKVPFKISAWIVSDKDAVNKDWWGNANLKFRGNRIFSVEVTKRTRASDEMPIRTFLIDKKPDGDFMRNAGTVAGCAITFCHINSVKHVVLCGVDMSGNTYYDGSDNPDERWMEDHGKVWTGRDILDERIKYLAACGMKVTTISKTKLKEVKKL